MGASRRPAAARALLALAAVALVAPLPVFGAAEDAALAEEWSRTEAVAPLGTHSRSAAAADDLDPEAPPRLRFADAIAGVSFLPPAGWTLGPASALNPVSDPPEPVFELARYQLRVADPALYATAVPVTSGLIADAVAVISVGVARDDGGLVGLELSSGDFETGSAPGFLTLDEEATYEGVHVLTRYFRSRASERVVVLRAAAAESDWSALAPQILAAASSVRADPRGPNAPAAPPPPKPTPQAVEPAPDPTTAIRQRILERAKALLGLRYVWGGNSTTRGMDCSAYVSWAWSVSRYTTDSIWQVSFPITKADLRPGDALNLTIGRDPHRRGHIRLFEAWANAERTLMWVYEETPPRVVHRVIVYDNRYQPIRLAGLSGAGDVRVIPGQPAPERTFRPVATRRPTPKPTVRVTPRPTVGVTPRPTGSALLTPRPTATASPRPLATSTPTTRPSPTPTRTP